MQIRGKPPARADPANAKSERETGCPDKHEFHADGEGPIAAGGFFGTEEFAKEPVECQSAARTIEEEFRPRKTSKTPPREGIFYSAGWNLFRGRIKQCYAARKSEIFSSQAENYPGRVLGASPGAGRSKEEFSRYPRA